MSKTKTETTPSTRPTKKYDPFFGNPKLRDWVKQSPNMSVVAEQARDRQKELIVQIDGLQKLLRQARAEQQQLHLLEPVLEQLDCYNTGLTSMEEALAVIARTVDAVLHPSTSQPPMDLPKDFLPR